ncbi:MAG: hypothetical protein KIT10_09115 [Flavobacteriales bacterium]|nr:hypothetical protein [Flavobacteriales bacterium]
MVLSLRPLLLPIVLLAAFFHVSQTLKAQKHTPPNQIKAVVEGLQDALQARRAGEALRTRKDVLKVWIDPGNRNMLLHVLPESDLDKSAIDALLADLGLTVRCMQRRDEVDKELQWLDPGTCQDATPNK